MINELTELLEEFKVETENNLSHVDFRYSTAHHFTLMRFLDWLKEKQSNQE